MNRSLRVTGYIVVGIVAGLLAASLIIYVLARTDWGMERARDFALGWLEDRVQGELEIGRISGPGLLGGATIHDFTIRDPRGRPFLHADSLRFSYDVQSLLGGSIVLADVVLFAPVVVIEKLPGDTAWNYEYVFPDTTPGRSTSARSLIMFEDARIEDGSMVLRLPLTPPLEPDDTARIIVEPVPGGLARAIRFERINGRLDRVIWESPIEEGRLFSIQSLATDAFLWRDPARIENMRGTMTARDTVVAFELPVVELPASRAAVLGNVFLTEAGLRVDARVEGTDIRFRDLQWLYPAFPDEGGGTLVLRVQSQPRGTLWYAENARLSAPGTNLAGSFGIVTGDTLYFTHVDLTASPLDLRLLEDMLPGELPVEGLLIGTVEITGPLSALRTSGDLELASGGGAASTVSWRGTIDLTGRGVASPQLRADVRGLDLALLDVIRADLGMSGRVTGHIEAAGRSTGTVEFTGDLEHTRVDRLVSHVTGSGRIERVDGERRIALAVDARQLSLRELTDRFPALAPLEGTASGPIHVSGGARDLLLRAELTTDGGTVSLNGSSSDVDGVPHYILEATASAFRLHALRPELPETIVSGSVTIDARTAAEPAGLHGSVRAELDTVRVAGVELGASWVHGALTPGLLHIDSAVVTSSLGIVRGTGSIALDAEHVGTLELALEAGSPEALADLFDATEAVDEGFAGFIAARATLGGAVGAFTLSGNAVLERVATTGLRAARVNIELAAGALLEGDSRFRLVAVADSLVLLGHPIVSARATAERRAGRTAIALSGGDDEAERVRLIGQVEHASEETRVHVEELQLGGAVPWTLAAPATVRVHDGELTTGAIRLVGDQGGTITVEGRAAWVADLSAPSAPPLDLHVRAEALPFADVLRLARVHVAGSGTVDGDMHIAGTPLDPVMDSHVHGRGIVYDDVQLDLVYGELGYGNGGIDAHVEAQHGGRTIISGGGRIPLDLRFGPVAERHLEEPLRFSLMADSLPPALLAGFVDGLHNARGRLDGALSVGGTTREPAFAGGLALRNGSLDWAVSGVGYRDISGNFILERDRVVRVDVAARAADPRVRNGRTLAGAQGGSGTVSGTIDFAELTDPAFDLEFSAQRVFATRRRDVELTTSGRMFLTGRYRRPELTGALHVDEGTLYLDELYRQYLVVALEDLPFVDTTMFAGPRRILPRSGRNPFVQHLLVRNAQITVGADSWLRSRDMDVEVTGSLLLSLDRSPEAALPAGLPAGADDLRLTGNLNVERGTYTLYYPPLQSRRFQVREGVIEFPGTPGVDPNLSITAAFRGRAQGNEPLDILASVTGTLQAPRVQLSSDSEPPLSESDLASYLFFGVPTWQVRNVAPGFDVDNLRSLGLRTFAPSVLGYAASGLQSLGQTYGLVDYVGITAAETENGTAESRLGNFFDGAQLELGRYIAGSDVFIGWSQRLASATFDPAIRLEWRFSPTYNLEFFIEDRFARTPSFGLRQEAGPTKSVYGFYLFREWGF